MTIIKNLVKAMLSIVTCLCLFALAIVLIPFAIVDMVITFGTMVVFDRMVD